MPLGWFVVRALFLSLLARPTNTSRPFPSIPNRSADVLSLIGAVEYTRLGRRVVSHEICRHVCTCFPDYPHVCLVHDLLLQLVVFSLSIRTHCSVAADFTPFRFTRRGSQQLRSHREG